MVWEFYIDVGHLEIITPPEMNLKILKSTSRKLVKGVEVWISASYVLPNTWHSRITYMEPYVLVDEMLSGKFKHWKHTHSFRKAENGTEIIDEIDLELPYGAFGKMFEGYAYKQLEKIFKYRKGATIMALSR